MKQIYLFTALFLLLSACNSEEKTNLASQWIASAPAGSEYVKIDKSGKTILPNGRFITPLGKQITTAPHPYGLILSPDGNIAVTANSGTSPFSITVIKNLLGENPIVQQIPEGASNDEGILEAVFMGLAISPDNQTLYVAGGEANKIFLFDLNTNQKKGEISCALKIGEKDKIEDFTHGYLGDMILSKDGKTLFVVDQINFRLIVIDTKKQAVTAHIPTGRYPFGVALSPDEKQIYVANVGVFEYSYYKDLDQKDLKNTSKPNPATAYNSKEMQEGVEKEGIPALGDPNTLEAFSVWAIDLTTSSSLSVSSQTNKITAKIKTGFLVGEKVEDFPTVGGSSPNSLVATEKYIFVSNGNNDCISVIDSKTNKVITNIFLTLDERLGNLRGIIPFGLTLSPDQKRLYVAEAGINAVGVIDISSLKLLGHIPTGWFPSKLKVSNDGKKLIVANAKGYGSGANGGKDFKIGDEGSYIGALMKGSVSVFTIPKDEELEKLTKQVVENNFKFERVERSDDSQTANPNSTPRSDDSQTANIKNPIPLYSKHSKSPIKYIVFISKENRTYDEVFAQNTNGIGDTSLARYGLNRTFSNKKGDVKLSGVDIMPNHHALAKRFAMSDNFYCDSDVSADGHRWLVGTYPNEWVETSVAASYGGKRNMRPESKAKGNLAFVGAAGAIFPEDYNEAGSMWEHLDRNKIDFFNFGFGVEMGSALYSDSTLKYGGVRYIVNYPLPEPLLSRTSKVYPTYNMAIPDQFRVDMFKKEFEEKWYDTLALGKKTTAKQALPQVITIIIPNDHGARERPHAGFPFVESYMADNDLAIGRIVEYLSNTPYWKNMAIVITEDDPQGGKDHIDAHRSLLMVISPYTKKNHVSHVHYSFGSIFKTFWHILGLPYLNQYDAGATDMADMFTTTPDFTPYRAVPIDKRLFDPQKALNPFDEKFDWKAFGESEEMDKVEDMQKRSKEDDKKE